MGDYNKSKKYYLAALQIAKKNADGRQTTELLINLAESFKETGAYDSAISYNNIALPIETALKDSVGVAVVLLNIGDDYNKKNQPEKALDYFRKCMALAARIHDEEDMAWVNLSMAQAWLREDKAALSLPYAATALKTARRISFTEIIKESYSVLYSDYRRLGNFAKALDYRNLEIALKDSIYTIDKDKKIKNLESGYELQKKQHEIDVFSAGTETYSGAGHRQRAAKGYHAYSRGPFFRYGSLLSVQEQPGEGAPQQAIESAEPGDPAAK